MNPTCPCLRATEVDGRPQAAICDRPLTDNAYVCSGCAGRMVTALAVVVELEADLELALSRQTSSAVWRPARVVSAPEGADLAPQVLHATRLPYDENASRVLGDIKAVLASWALLLLEDHPSEIPSDTISGVAEWLSARSELLRHHVAGPDAVRELIALAQSARWVVFPRRPDLVFVTICCRLAVYAETEDIAVSCRTCGKTYDVDEQRTPMLTQLDDHLLNAVELARGVSGVTASMVYGWAHRRRIAAHGADAEGRPLYRVGDVKTLMAERAERERKVRSA